MPETNYTIATPVPMKIPAVIGGLPFSGPWHEPIGRFEFDLIVTPEDVGFSVCAASVPGVISEGDSLEEAIANIREAFIGVLEARNGKLQRRTEPLSPTGSEFEAHVIVDWHG